MPAAKLKPLLADRARPLLEGVNAWGCNRPDNRIRVFYRVDAEERQVRILAIAVKERNRVFIAGEEVEL